MSVRTNSITSSFILSTLHCHQRVVVMSAVTPLSQKRLYKVSEHKAITKFCRTISFFLSSSDLGVTFIDRLNESAVEIARNLTPSGNEGVAAILLYVHSVLLIRRKQKKRVAKAE